MATRSKKIIPVPKGDQTPSNLGSHGGAAAKTSMAGEKKISFTPKSGKNAGKTITFTRKGGRKMK